MVRGEKVSTEKSCYIMFLRVFPAQLSVTLNFQMKILKVKISDTNPHPHEPKLYKRSSDSYK